MKRLVFVFCLLAVLSPVAVTAQTAAANRAWAPFLKKFSAAVKARNRSAILSMALPCSSFETTAGGDCAEDLIPYLKASDLKSGFTARGGGKFTRKGCMWFKFIGNKWYWAGSPCD